MELTGRWVAHVADDEEVGVGVLQCARRLLHDAVVRVALAAHRVLRLRDAEQQHAADPEWEDLSQLALELIDGELRMPRHRLDRLLYASALDDEEGMDQLRDVERGLAHEGTERRGAPCPARPQAMEWRVGGLLIGHANGKRRGEADIGSDRHRSRREGAQERIDEPGIIMRGSHRVDWKTGRASGLCRHRADADDQRTRASIE